MPEGEERENKTVETLEIMMAEKFTKSMLDTEPQIQEVYRTTRKIIIIKTPIPRYIIC